MKGYGLLNVRKAIVLGKVAVITHRDPQTGRYWVEDREGNPKASFWIDSHLVKFID